MICFFLFFSVTHKLKSIKMPLCQPEDFGHMASQGLLLYQKLPIVKVIGLMLHKAKPVPLMFPLNQPPG